MTRPRRSRMRAELPDDALDWLRDGDGGAWIYFTSEAERAALWREYGEAVVVAEHVAEYPGTRPRRWWEYDAPEPRRRLGGVGTPAHECLAYIPQFAYGIPMIWVSQFDADYYNGRGRDIHGKPIGTKYRDGNFTGVPIDPNDPPIFESQAAYLRRHGLLLPGERKRLKAAAFDPELVMEPRRRQ